MSSTCFTEMPVTFAVMYGCTPKVMDDTIKWLQLLTGPTFHPLILPMVFMELERKRLCNALDRMRTNLSKGILMLENKINLGKQTADGKTGEKAIEEVTKRDFESFKDWLSVSSLDNGFQSFKTQLECMIKHSASLPNTAFSEFGCNIYSQRETGDRIESRLYEMFNEIESKSRRCRGLLGGITLSTQMVSLLASSPSLSYERENIVKPILTVLFVGIQLLYEAGYVLQHRYRKVKHRHRICS
jgi:hypothetical protein